MGKRVKIVSHRDLVIRAGQYLSGTCNCNPVFTEKGSAKVREAPDAIGWTSSSCYIIECKISFEDLLADAKKPSRIDQETGMGNYRFYLLTNDVYEKISDNIDQYILRKWGILIHQSGDMAYRRRLKIRDAVLLRSNMLAEKSFLRSRILEIQRFGK